MALSCGLWWFHRCIAWSHSRHNLFGRIRAGLSALVCEIGWWSHSSAFASTRSVVVVSAAHGCGFVTQGLAFRRSHPAAWFAAAGAWPGLWQPLASNYVFKATAMTCYASIERCRVAAP